MDRSTVNKLQHQYWVTKQTVYRKLGKKEDECIVASDSELDAKLELYKSIHKSSGAMNKLLDRFQDKICALAQEQNEFGRFLKEYGKADKSPAGKMMIQMGKSLIYSSQQEIGLRPPLLRLYQEVETFRNRAVEDTHGTIQQMEKHRTEYRASLNWMKKVSQELDPDTNKQMEKFRKVQNHVKGSKSQFDKLKLACLQKVDLLAAARCNMFSHALIQYIQSMTKITSKNSKVFNTLAITFKGHQYFEFSVIKELAEPSRKLAEDCGNKPATEELLFDFNEDMKKEQGQEEARESKEKETDTLVDTSDSRSQRQLPPTEELVELSNASVLLETLLGPMDQSPETEKAQDALDLGLDLAGPSTENKDSSDSLINVGSFISKKETKKDVPKEKTDDVMSLLASEEFEGLSFEQESGDTLALLNEILSARSNPAFPSASAGLPAPLIPPLESRGGGDGDTLMPNTPLGPQSSTNISSSSFMPSYLLDLGGLNLGSKGSVSGEGDLLNLSAPASSMVSSKKPETGKTAESSASNKNWYDIFSDLDPLGNPDAIGEKDKGNAETENRYC